MFQTVKTAIVLLLLTTLSTSSLIACGGNGNGTEEVNEPIGSDAPIEPVPTGTLTMATAYLASNPDAMTPFSRNATHARAWYSCMADYLVYEKMDKSGFNPGLAEEWEISPDRTSITFKLRHGVQFHDGWGELTSEDVRFTLESVFDPQLSGYAEAQASFGPMVDHIETSGPYEITIHLNTANAEDVLFHVCPSHALGIGITCKAYYDDVGFRRANQHPVFSGPYKFVEFTMGDTAVFEAVETHWRVVPEFEKIVFKEVPELMTRVAMLETGEADLIEITAEQAETLANHGFDIVSLNAAMNLSMFLLGQWFPSTASYDPESPFLNEKIREAMNISIDREGIAQHLFNGYAEPAAGLAHTPWSDSLNPYPFDPDRARQLLIEAGYDDGFDLDMWIVAFGAQPPEIDMATIVVAEYWEDIGINTNIDRFNVMAVYGDIVQRNTTGKCFGFGLPNSGEPYGTVRRQRKWDKSAFKLRCTFRA